MAPFQQCLSSTTRVFYDIAYATMGVVDDLELLDESEASPRLGEVELRPSWGPEYSVQDVATVRG